MPDECSKCGEPYQLPFPSVSPYEVMSLAERETKVRPHRPGSLPCVERQLAAAEKRNAVLEAVAEAARTDLAARDKVQAVSERILADEAVSKEQVAAVGEEAEATTQVLIDNLAALDRKES